MDLLARLYSGRSPIFVLHVLDTSALGIEGGTPHGPYSYPRSICYNKQVTSGTKNIYHHVNERKGRCIVAYGWKKERRELSMLTFCHKYK